MDYLKGFQKFIRLGSGVFAALSFFVVPSMAHAQWTVTVLHPAGGSESFTTGAGGSQQVGYAPISGSTRAGMWSGTAGSWVSLNPAGSTQSYARGASASQQVGSAFIGGQTRAGLWTGVSTSWVSLHPSGATESVAFATTGSQQAGFARISGVKRAGIWTGTPGSWVSLHPTGAVWSEAFGTSGNQQVGYARVINVDNASLWTGSSSSWVNLHPTGSPISRAFATNGTQQVGYAYFLGTTRAVLWSGTAASLVDLHPIGYTDSQALAISGTRQVGLANLGGLNRASLWTGTSASWQNLHAVLPSQYFTSVATGISSDGVNLYVTGYGYNNLTARDEALLWTQPLSVPNTLSGTLDLGQLGGTPYNSGANLPATLNISYRDAANTEIAVGTATYNPVTGAVTGTVPVAVNVPYRISVKVGFWLRKTMPNPADPAAPVGNYNFGTIAPLVGDSDDDNEVTNFDYSLWAAANGNSVTANTDNDFDGDGAITNFDYSLWAANNGALGDN